MFIKLYLIALPVFLFLDAIWLGVIAKDYYAREIGFLMKTDINWVAAIAFYLLFLVGLVVFVIQPSITSESWKHALFLGLLFGLVTYATYDLTNLATIKNWPFLMTLIDLMWGAFLAASVSIITFWIAKKFGI